MSERNYDEAVRAVLDSVDFDEGKGEPRDQRFEMRLTKGELNGLRARASLYMMRPSQLIRKLCCEDPRRGIDPMLTANDWKLAGDYVGYRMAADRIREEVFGLRRDVGRVGGNVNQIARKVNGAGDYSDADDMRIRRDFAEIKSKVDALNERCDRLLVPYESLDKFIGEG